ncbi:MAG: gliding motility-associated C-terminal domain-containing protein, partial [Bacteroidetes bacterium]|nr:gliding motility-associated C-terminal domain-containing protein [Bacteroidota bacterium]
PSVSITRSPLGAICAGTSVTFTATPTNGGTTPVYQWKLNGANVGTNSPTYTNATLINGNTVSCEMTSNAVCASPTTVASNVITMTVTPTVTPSVSIARSPSGTICAGTSVTFTATPTNGGTTPVYQWKLNGANVGTNSPTYTNATLINGNTVSCEMTSNAVCASPATVTSNVITMSVSLTVAPSVSISMSPSGEICAGTNLTFTATPTNGGVNPGYQWKLNGANVGTNSINYSNSSLVSGDVIHCEITSSLTCSSPATASSNTITITISSSITPSVSISQTPAGSFCSGTTLSFTATPANGGSVPSYQWLLNGSNVGPNSSTYSSSMLNDGDVISCIMTSELSCASPTAATSNSITITVIPNVVPIVSIAASPSETICEGTAVTFTATSSNGGTNPIYQWKLNGINVGTNSATYFNSSLVNGNSISCEITSNAACASPTNVTSNTVTMSVTPTVVPSVNITASPSETICEGTSVTFTALASNGGAAPDYQWKLNGANVGTNSSTYTNSTLLNGDVLTCQMTSNATCANPQMATSNSISITVSPTAVPTVSIVASPTGTICEGTTVTFTASGINEGNTPIYQWKLNGNNVGSNSPIYTNATLSNGNTITCELTSNAACANPTTVFSNSISITVSPSVVPSLNISSSQTGVICNGTSVSFTASPVNQGASPLYQWTLNGTFVGTNSATYSNTSLSNGDVIVCQMTSDASCASPSTVTSNTITITASPNVVPSVNIVASPSSAVCFGTAVTFIATPTNGGATPVYQWKLNGVNVGTNAASYSNSTLTNGNIISCEIISNAPCASPTMANSNVISMSISNISLITTTFNASCFGSSNGNASVSANGGQAPYTFLWNDASSQTTNTASALTAGNYTVIVTDNNGCVQTSEVIITQPAPINLTVTSVSSKCGQNNGSATVLALGGTGIYTYLWNDPLNQSTSTANALAEGIYTVTVMDGNNCSKSTGVQIDNISTMELTVDISSVTCFGANNGSATVNVSGPGGITSPYSYLWNDSLSQTTPIASNLTAGTYKATVTDNGGCSQSISVIIHEPLALLNATTSVNTSCGDNKGEISLETSGGIAPYTYLWSNMQTTKQISQLLAGDYTVLTKDANNCSRTDAVLVSDSVTEDCLFIPNAFSPNGDGNHDLWVIGNSDIYSQISVEIYNRWGNKVYASDNYANDWDGIRNGEKLPGGVYFYTINLNNGQKPISGSLTLLH